MLFPGWTDLRLLIRAELRLHAMMLRLHAMVLRLHVMVLRHQLLAHGLCNKWAGLAVWPIWPIWLGFQHCSRGKSEQYPRPPPFSYT